MDDFRLKVGMPRHPKIKKLRRYLGGDGFYSLICLYEFATQYRPRGVLFDMDHEDIELAADWDGEAGKFVQCLLDIKLMECNGEWCEIHDWSEHNPWAYEAPERKEQAKKAAEIRWGKRKKKRDDNTDSIRPACDEHADSNAPFLSFPLKTLAQRFEKFWQAYPKKKSKGHAEKTWMKLKPSEQLLETMLSTIERAKTSEEWTKENGKYIPYPSTWLNAKGWEDEYDTPQENKRERLADLPKCTLWDPNPEPPPRPIRGRCPACPPCERDDRDLTQRIESEVCCVMVCQQCYDDWNAAVANKTDREAYEEIFGLPAPPRQLAAPEDGTYYEEEVQEDG